MSVDRLLDLERRMERLELAFAAFADRLMGSGHIAFQLNHGAQSREAIDAASEIVRESVDRAEAARREAKLDAARAYVAQNGASA